MALGLLWDLGLTSLWWMVHWAIFSATLARACALNLASVPNVSWVPLQFFCPAGVSVSQIQSSVSRYAFWL